MRGAVIRGRVARTDPEPPRNAPRHEGLLLGGQKLKSHIGLEGLAF
jgi:hypothetical protein